MSLAGPLRRNMFRVLVLMLLISVSMASAATLGLDFVQPSSNSTNGQWTLGYEFEALQSVSVTGLAFYTGGGITQNHVVGLWDSNGVLLASATITSGSALIGNGWFQWEAISPVLLTAGSYYRVAGDTGVDDYTWAPTGVTVDATISFVSDRYISGGGLVFPTDATGNVTGWFGGNIVLGDSAVPEPSSMALMLAGGAMLVGLARRRASRS